MDFSSEIKQEGEWLHIINLTLLLTIASGGWRPSTERSMPTLHSGRKPSRLPKFI